MTPITKEQIREYSYSNGRYSFSLLNLGLTLTSLNVPDRNGKIRNVILPFPGGKENPDMILNPKAFLNFTVGRFANRIADARFTLNGKTYTFEPNNNGNLLHSGFKGLWRRLWNIQNTEDGLMCTITVSEEDDGFPGTMVASVRFSLSETGEFSIHYRAISTEDCPMNFTNHAYFNFHGNGRKDTLDHVLQMDCSTMLEVNDKLIPTGNLPSVLGGPYDFTKAKEIGKDGLALGGYDNAFVIDRPQPTNRDYRKFCSLYCEESGIHMDVSTDLPSVQLYTGGNLMKCEPYVKHGAVCLETQYYPDCVNHSNFPSCIVKAGEVFESRTTYAFSIC